MSLKSSKSMLLYFKVNPTGWRGWFVTGHLHLRLWIRPRVKLVDFHNAENMTVVMSYDCKSFKRSLECECLAWILPAKLNPSTDSQIVRAQVPLSVEDTRRQNYLRKLVLADRVTH
ncbi:hypothetical protein TNCV_854631 [Trichonephila clavipes]|nr:hypothetical protein TNCV_854631 [Trichonephila clavipes]